MVLPRRLSSIASSTSERGGGSGSQGHGNPLRAVPGGEFRQRLGEPSITLKNLQILRICHALMLLAFLGPGVLGCRGVLKSATVTGTVRRGRQSWKMERALKHKYSVGETVYFTASNVARPAASGTYEVIRLLPTDGDDCQYRIKSSTEAFERVAKESQLALS